MLNRRTIFVLFGFVKTDIICYFHQLRSLFRRLLLEFVATLRCDLNSTLHSSLSTLKKHQALLDVFSGSCAIIIAANISTQPIVSLIVGI